MRVRVIYLSVAVMLVGCTVVRPAPLPAPDAALKRAMIHPGPLRCRQSTCRTRVDIGSEQLQVESQARVMSSAKALGEHRSLPGTVITPMIGELLVMLGASVGEDQIGLGTRQVTAVGDASHSLRCNVGWIQEERRTRRDGKDEYDIRRLAEGMECDVVRAGDSAVTWRFRAGTPPSPRSLAGTAESRARSSTDLRLDVNMRLEHRVDTPYVMTLDSAATNVMHAPLSVWGVNRPDGTRIGTLLWRYGVGSSAIDLSPSITPEERRVLHLIIAALVAPLVATQ